MDSKVIFWIGAGILILSMLYLIEETVFESFTDPETQAEVGKSLGITRQSELRKQQEIDRHP